MRRNQEKSPTFCRAVPETIKIQSVLKPPRVQQANVMYELPYKI